MMENLLIFAIAVLITAFAFDSCRENKVCYLSKPHSNKQIKIER